jgi:hypothetical protein
MPKVRTAMALAVLLGSVAGCAADADDTGDGTTDAREDAGGDPGLPDDALLPDGDAATAEDAPGDESTTEDAAAEDAPPGDDGGPEVLCIETPSGVSPDPPITTCNHMDWSLSSDGYYLLSQFGTTNDPTTLGRTTTCGYLQGHYDYHDCVWDNQTGGCVATEHVIPWVQGDVDYDYDTVLAEVDAHIDGDVPTAEYFYVAGAQRFMCGSTLRVTNTENERCVVVYAEDGGPGSEYEDAGFGGRRILDSSPAVVRYLQAVRVGWASSTMLYVEWGLPGDVPGRRCTRCMSLPASSGYSGRGTAFDPNHMMPSFSCRDAVCGDGLCGPGEDHSTCPGDCPACEPIPPEGRIVDETDRCFRRGGTASYWHTESAGYGGSLIWTYATADAAPDNHGIWELDFAAAGTYLVEAYTAAPWARSRQAAYQVTHGGTTDRVVVDQSAVDGWSSVGRFAFATGSGQSVRLDDNTGEPVAGDVQLVFDAVRITPAP